MQMIKCSEVIEATKGKLVSGSDDTEFLNISTDSRSIRSGELFIPIKGERFDGHDYIEDALRSGGAGTITQRDITDIVKGNREAAFEKKVIIKVDDTLKALKDLALYYRQKFKIPFVGITGSVGKTSTKDMVACILMQEYNVLKTQGNFNNEIGVPLTIFKLEPYHEAAVLEMGMSGLGEISSLTSIVRPQIAVITNIGMSHIGKLGSRQNILKAKMEIVEGVPRNGLVVLNGDDNLLYGLKGFLNRRTVYYGMDEGVDYQAYNIQNAGESGVYFDINIKGREYNIHVPLPGVHNVYNTLAAIAVGVEMEVPVDKIIEGVKFFTSDKMRLNIISYNKIKIINDTYNASPQSMEAALRVLKDINGYKRRIAVLGDMLELGEWAYNAHFNIGKFAVSLGIDYIITVGENGKSIAEGALEAGARREKVKSFPDNIKAIEFLKDLVTEEDVILVKGSRGMGMEEIVLQLTK
ncbi:MAG: UDP-N-acetylmuramoyl-tripeptide--D-alanyl-D-alanine ligase [Firmicutes bacterium]|nr:UDP-N-acetylmuramoyl-tripeptide--D-alanyl-D-alanine ligase [Bacillota bacterium]